MLKPPTDPILPIPENQNKSSNNDFRKHSKQSRNKFCEKWKLNIAMFQACPRYFFNRTITWMHARCTENHAAFLRLQYFSDLLAGLSRVKPFWSVHGLH